MHHTRHEQGTPEDQLRSAIARAEAESRSNNTATVICQDIVYDLHEPLVVSGHVSLVSEGFGKRATVLRFRDIKDDQRLLTIRNGNACRFQGISIRDSPNKAQNVVGLRVESMSSSTLSDFEVRLTHVGNGNVGIVHERVAVWGESVVMEKFDCRAENPLRILSGDNITIRDWDMTCTGDKSTTGEATAIISAGPMSAPDHWHIGPGTGQRGDHALMIKSDARRTGSGLSIDGFRWEQGTDWGQAAWHVEFSRTGHCLEFMRMTNCRHSQRKSSTFIDGVMRFDHHGYLPGKHVRK